MLRSHPDISGLVPPLARRVNFAVWINLCLRWTGALVALSAAAALVLKVLWPGVWSWAAAPLVLVPLVLPAAWYWCNRKGLFFATPELIEILDHLYLDDGSLTSAYEAPALASGPDFYTRVRAALSGRLPRLDGRHYLRRAVPVLIFAALALAVPPRPPADPAPEQEALAALAQPLLEKVDEYRELLPEEDAEELTRQLEELRDSPEGISREKWEALEEMAERVDEAVARSQQSAVGLAGTLAQLSSVAGQNASSATGTEDPGNIEGLLDQLGQSLSDPHLGLSSGLQKRIAGAMSGMESGRGMSEAMRQQLAELAEQMAGMCEGMGEEPGPGDGEGYGRGGIDRGRGDAPMVFGEERQIDGNTSPEELRNKYLDPADLVDLGITPVEPEPDPGGFSPGTVRQFEGQAGAAVSRTRITPSQKDVISRYFGETGQKE